MADLEAKYYLFSADDKDSRLLKSGRGLKLVIALLCASCLALLSFGMEGSGKTSNGMPSSGVTYLRAKPPQVKGKPVKKTDSKRMEVEVEVEETPESTKKLKKSQGKPTVPPDPVQLKIDAVCDALRNPEYDVNCREMLLVAAPLALREVTNDGAHEWYSNVVNMISDTFTAQNIRLKERRAEKQALVDGADEQHRVLEGQLNNTESQLQAKQMDIDAKRATQDTHMAYLTECQDNSTRAVKEYMLAKAALGKLVWMKEKHLKEQNEDLDMAREKAMALGGFDSNVNVSELDNFMNTHLSNLAQQIQDAQGRVAEKEAKKQEAALAVEAAQAPLTASSEAVANAETEREALDTELTNAQQAIEEHHVSVKNAGNDVEIAQSDLDALQNVMNQFQELRERRRLSLLGVHAPEELKAEDSMNTSDATAMESLMQCENKLAETTENTPMEVMENKPMEATADTLMEANKETHSEPAGSPVIFSSEVPAENNANVVTTVSEYAQPSIQGGPGSPIPPQSAVQTVSGFHMSSPFR